MSILHPAGLMAVWRRQLGSLLGNPLGYVFILAFVALSGAYLFLFRGEEFFNRDLADLGLLLPVMPWFLVVLLPALAMGAWATERELGTEELLLTMPMGVLDAVLGKYLAVITYFTIALACSLSNVVVLCWLGSPDPGLIAANYLGWWFAGLAFAAWALFASVMVALPAIAFVLGVVFCATVMFVGGQLVHWFDAFDRGVLSAGGIVAALAIAAAGVGASVLLIASRRWRPSQQQVVVSHLASLAFGLALAVNIAVIAERYGVDADVSVERVSSLSDDSGRILATVTDPVTVAAFISRDLPNELQAKGQEVLDKLKALQRLAGGKVKVDIYRPEDPLDKYAQLASQDYGLKPRSEMVETVSGKEKQDVFLGAAVTSGGRSQLIDYFDPGLPVEYELVRAVRTVGTEKKHVVGVASSDMLMMAGFDMQTYQPRPAWQIVDEWKKQYEVREISLDGPVADEVEVLVVPQPSSLTDPQLKTLHDYIWAGRPAMLMEDPLPFWTPNLAASQPKRGGNPYGPSEGPKKGDLKPLLHALGVEFDLNQVVFSTFNPSHQFRDIIPAGFVWVRREQKGLSAESPITKDLAALLMPWPGMIKEAADKHPGLSIKPLLRGAVPWAKHPYYELIQTGNPMMGPQYQDPKRHTPQDPNNPPVLAVEITGTMPSAYAKPDPSAAKPAPGPDGKPGDAPADKVGVPSAKPVHVILVADSDFVNDAFFQIYRNQGNRFSEEQVRFLLDVRNIQFASNALDALLGDQELSRVRSHQVALRPLAREDSVLNIARAETMKDIEAAQIEAETKINDKQSELNARVDKIDARGDLDELGKSQLKEQVRSYAERDLDRDMQEINRRKDLKIQAAKVEQRRIITLDRNKVKTLALSIPAMLLAVLILAVFSARLARERSHIPASRKRSFA